jgi:1-acyl-sn-glycerol-3-phosphate acyltransferase
VLLSTTLDDAVTGLGAHSPATKAALRLALLPFALRFRREVEAADAATGRLGLAAASELLLRAYSGPVTYVGLDGIPADGPLIVAANHPGGVDTPALMAALSARPDLRVLALDRPFLRAIPHIAAHLLYVGESAEVRGDLVRRAASHLRAGGALLSFPAGESEPDPAVRNPDAVAAVARWSRSTELLARLAPGVTVLPVAVSGVLSERALAHPLSRARASVEDRELAAATLQIVRRDRDIRPKVIFGEPLRGRPDAVGAALADAMAALLRG